MMMVMMIRNDYDGGNDDDEGNDDDDDAADDVGVALDGGENDFGIQIFRYQHLFQPVQFAGVA